MTAAFTVATLAMVGYCLWIRRDTWWSRWESGATFGVAMQGCALILLTPWAATELGPPLHSLLGMWNAQQLLGWMCVLACTLANVYHMLVRLTDPEHVRPIMRKHFLVPVIVCETAIVVGFFFTKRGFEPDPFVRTSGDGWMTVVEAAGSALMLYVGIYVGRLMLALRHDRRARTTLALYVTAMALAFAGGAITVLSAVVDHYAGPAIWACFCLSTAVLAYGSARSWLAKAAWFTASGSKHE